MIKILTKKEVAQRLRMSERTLDRHIASRKIAFARIGGKILFSEEDVDSFFHDHKHPKRKF